MSHKLTRTFQRLAFGRVCMAQDEDAVLTATMLAQQAVRYCVEESGRHDGRRVIEKLLPDVFTHCSSVAWPILSGSMEAHRDRIWKFESLLRIHDLEGKSVVSPVFLVPWEVLRAWCHKHPEFAPAFLMRIAPTFEARAALATESERKRAQEVAETLDLSNGTQSCGDCWTISATAKTYSTR